MATATAPPTPALEEKPAPPTGPKSGGDFRIPPVGSSPEVLRAFLQKIINYESPVRLQRMRQWELARLFYAGEHWVEDDATWGTDPTHSPFLKPIQIKSDQPYYPMPVCNETTPAIQNDVVRLVQKGTRGYVRQTSPEPKHARAAKTGSDVLNDDLLPRLSWPEKDHDWCHQISLYGTGILKAWIDFDSRRTVLIPLSGLLKCPACSFTLASATIPDDEVMPQLARYDEDTAAGRPPRIEPSSDIDEDTGEESWSAEATHCLTCPPDAATGQAPALEPYTPSPDQLKATPTDYFDAPMGEQQPLIDVNLSVVPCYDMFLQNSGVGRVGDQQEYAEAHIETLEWIRAHYPNGKMVRPDSSEKLLKWHPLLGGSYLYGGTPASDFTLYRNHALVQEFHCEPYIDEDGTLHEKGRSIVMAGDIVLLDGDYLIASRLDPSRMIPRCLYSVTQWDLRDGMIWGLSCAELLIPTQVRINFRLSQVETTRNLWANPKWMAEEGMELQARGGVNLGDYQGDVIYYRPQVGGEKPYAFPGMQLDPQWIQEHNIDVQNIRDNAGVQDVDVGTSPGNGSSPWAASTLIFLGQQSTKRREDRLARIRFARQKVFSYLLSVIHEFYREPRYYSVRGRNDRWDVKSFIGTDLLGQTNVMIDEQAMPDDAATRSLVVNQAVGAGTLIPSSAADKKRINKYLGLPSDLNEETNLQVEIAEEEYFDFLNGRMPAVSRHCDSHVIHAQQHQTDWLRDDARYEREQVDWGQIEMALWNWEEEFNQLEVMEQQLKAAPPGDAPPMPIPGEDGRILPESRAQIEQWQAMKQAEQMIAALPEALELRLWTVWLNTLKAKLPTLAPDMERAKRVAELLRFYAHFIAHQRLAAQEAMMANAGVAQPAPVAGPSTDQGMIPGAGSATSPGPGAGPGAVTEAGAGVPK